MAWLGIVLQQQGDEILMSGLKVLVDGRDVGHDTLPIWPLCVNHLIDVLQQRMRLNTATMTGKIEIHMNAG